MYRFFVPCAAAALMALPFLVFAHQTGVSFEKEIGAYLIDTGYDPPQPQGGERIVFDFNLKSKTDKTPEPFDYVWVRLEKDTSTLLATGIARADFGPTSLLYQIPENMSGNLSVNVRYQKGDQALAETDFTIPVTVPRRAPSDFMIPIVSAIVGAAVAAGISFFILRRRNGVI